MRIVRAAAYRQFQPFRDGIYTCRGQSVDGTDSTIVRLETDSGLVGWGEVAPLGSFYSEAFAAGARAGLAELLPRLIGVDPRRLALVDRLMDEAMLGQPYVKSPIDMACWDLLGRFVGLPIFELAGGRFGDSVPLYRSISQGPSERMAEAASGYVTEGYGRIQVKVGGDPLEDIERVRAVRAAVPSGTLLVVDANGAWQVDAALRFVQGMADADYYLEQPCMTLAENARVRRAVRQPMILDESILSLDDLLAAHEAGLAEGITLKLSRVGGMTKARLLRDVAVTLGLRVTIEDTGGSDIDTAATTHLMLSTPEPARFHTVDLVNWVTARNATDLPPTRNGRITAPTGPGLGLTVLEAELGEPFFTTG